MSERAFLVGKGTLETRRCEKGGGVRWLWAAWIGLLLMPTTIWGAGGLADGPVQTYFVPIDEAHVILQAAAINLAAPTPPASDTVHTVVSLSSTTDGTVICYDHWEDGYEADLSNPVQPTTLTINLDAGDFTVLENDVVASPRDPAVVLFDARDRIGTSDQIAVTRGGWRLQEGTQLAGAVEVFPAVDWGTRFESPVGEDLASPTFELVIASVTANELGAVLEVDLDGDGTADEVRRLGPGENTLIENVVVGTSFVSSDPVEVHLLTGDRGSTFAGRWYSLVPTEQWSDSYYNPVGTAVAGQDTVVTLYNPHASAITVTQETLIPTLVTSSFENTTTGAISNAATPCATPLVRDFVIGSTFDVSEVRLGLVADHVYRGDIQATLESPAGTRVVVVGSNGGDANDNYDIQFEQAAAAAIDDGTVDNTAAPFYDRTVGPTGSLAAFSGESSVGTWRLEVCDVFGVDDGTFLRARLQLSEVTSASPSTSTLTVPAGGVTTFVMPLDSGGHFFTAGGEDFFALTAIDFDNTAADWGFTLLPEENLTTTLVVGWAPGRDPTSAVNPTENGSPIWVTANAATNLHVDFDGDPTTGALVDIEGNRFDQLVAIGALMSVRLFDLDNDQSGARIYTLDGTLITAAWGQDPSTASPASPGLDLGTTVVPISRLRIVKEGVLVDDIDGDGGIDPGESIRYTITITNVSDAVIPAATLEDTGLDTNVAYVATTTEVDGVSVADDAVGATIFPLDEGGLDLGGLNVNQTITVTFDVTVDNPLPGGVEGLANVAKVRAGTETETDTEVVPVGDPELLITKVSDVVGDALPGQIITYTVGVTNSAGVAHRGIKVLDTLPASVTYVSASTNAVGFVPVITTTSYDTTTTAVISAATPCATPLVRTFAVTDTFVLTDVDLGLRADHAYRGDIQAILESPAGTRITVIASSGADGNDNYDMLLADGSVGAINDDTIDDTAAPFYDRGANPSNALAGFNGETANGTWRLEVCDAFTGADDGTFNSAQLRVGGESQVATTKTNQAAAILPLTDGDPTNLILAPDAFELQPAQTMTVSYQVQVADPLDINTTSIINTAKATSIQQPFPVIATVVDPVTRGGVLGDRVWLDADGDGVQDLGEPGLANVMVELFDPGLDGMPGGGDDVSLGTATTDANGNYLFDFLLPGDYFVAVDDTTLPTGLAASPGTSDPSAVVTIVGEEAILDVDFGYTIADPSTGIIGDFVWSDASVDGSQDPGEVGLANVDIELVNGSGVVVATVTTGVDGSYLFTGVAPGEYTVRIAAAELGPGGDLDGYSATVGPQSEGGSVSDPVTVAASDVMLDVDFGFADPLGTFSVDDVFWLDLDADGLFDVDEEPLAGVTVDLLDAGGDVVATATSAADGSFSFDGLAPGSYTLSVSDNMGVLAGLGGTTSPAAARQLAVTIVASDLTGVNFGYNAAGTLGDRIWNDADGDGVQDAGESGLAGVTVELLDLGGSVIATTVTDGAGNYLLEGLAPDQYTVRVDAMTLPAGFALTGDPDASQDGESAVALATGESDLTLDFGYQNASLPDLSGTVFEDLDADGTEDGGEPGFPNVSVALQRTYGVINAGIDVNGDGIVDGTDNGFIDGVEIIAGRPDMNGDGAADGLDAGVLKGVTVIGGWMDANGDGSTAVADRPLDNGTIVCDPIATTTTDAAGNYSFPDLLDGDYVVAVVDAAGVLADYQLTSGLDTLSVTIVGVDITDVDFGYIRNAGTASIGDVLWLDADRNGIQDAGEPGAPGATVRLFDAGPDGVIGGGDDTLIATTTTDANGGYVFDGLDPGNYFVDPDEATLSGLMETVYPVGTNPSAVIALSEGEDFNDADFGYVSLTNSAIGDTVWYDADGDGVQDAGEVGIAGVEITIDGPSGPVTATTGPDGSWLATGLAPGLYGVTVDPSTLPAGYDPVPTNAGVSYLLDVEAGTDYYHLDWGFNGGTTGSIGDTVFFDTDANGSQGVGEGGIEGVTINLLDDLGNVIAITTTAADGSYDFVGLAAGDYTLEVTDVAGVLSGLNVSTLPIGSVTLAAGEDYDLADYGYAPSGGAGSIGSQVWWDADGDGTLDSDESGFQGVTIDLWLDVDGDGVITPGTDNLLRTITTASNGEYALNGLPPADYIVQVTDTGGALAGFSHTLGTPGVDGQSQPETYPVTLTTAAPSNLTADFGYFLAMGLSISGTVFEDDDESGTHDEPGEPVVEGVMVNLFRVINGMPVMIGTTTTDVNGNYSFDDLPDGDYVVAVESAGTAVDGYDQTTQDGTGGVQLVTLAGVDSADNDFGFFDSGLVTNPVTLASFHADGTGFEWTTATETGNIGFNLWRYDHAIGMWLVLNDAVVPSTAVYSATVQHYDYDAGRAFDGPFLIEDVDVRGRPRFHGPFELGQRYGHDVSAEPIAWDTVRAAHETAVLERGLEKAGVDSSTAELRLSESGLYRVTYEQLRAAGIDFNGVPTDELAMSSSTGPVPARVVGPGASFGAGGFVEWVGEGMASLYTRENVYRLRRDASQVARPTRDDRSVSLTANAPDYYLETVSVGADKLYSFGAPNGDPWYDVGLVATSSSVARSYGFALPDLVRASVSIDLMLDLWGVTDFPEAPDHHVVVSVNGVAVADATFDGLVAKELHATLDGVLDAQGNTLEVRLPHDTDALFDLVNIEGFSITYPRAPIARNGYLRFEAEAAVLEVQGLASPLVEVYRLEGNRVSRVEQISISLETDGYRVRFNGSSTVATYVVTEVGALRTPDVRPGRVTVDLLDTPAEFLVIAHPDFLVGIEPLASARRGEGLTVRVVDLEDVYTAYSGGNVDAAAIHAYVKDAHQRIGTRSVLLVGADSYDYLDNLGLGAISFVPTLYGATDDIVSFAPVDARFGDVNGDNVPDVAVGRFPVRTPDQLEHIVVKTLAYPVMAAERTAVFAADAYDAPNDHSFTADSETSAVSLPQGWQLMRAYIDTLGVAEAKVALVDALDAGVSLASYFGHSGPTSWSFSGLFTANNAAALLNAGRPTVVTQWGCWNTYYVSPQNETMGHKLMTSGNQGAVAVLGASTLTTAETEQALALHLMPRLFRPGQTLGSAVVGAKQALAASDGTHGRLDVLLGWNLLGDPTLRLVEDGPQPGLPFEDGFESGDTSAWTHVVP